MMATKIQVMTFQNFKPEFNPKIFTKMGKIYSEQFKKSKITVFIPVKNFDPNPHHTYCWKLIHTK